MTLTVGTVQVVLQTDLDRFSGSMRSAANEVTRSNATMASAVARTTNNVTMLERSVRGFDAGAAMRPLAVSILRANDSATQLRNTLLLIPAALGGIGVAAGTRSLGQMAEQAASIRNRLAVVTKSTSERLQLEQQTFAIAQRTRSEYASTAILVSRMAQASQNLGRSQGDVLKFVEAVQQTAQISGSGTSEARSAAIQLAQGLGSGRFQGDELRSVLENNIQLAQILAEELAGGSVGRLREMGSEGLLEANNVLDAVLRRREEIASTFARTEALPSNGITVLNNALVKYVGELDSATGASQAFFNLMVNLSNVIPQVGTSVLTLIAALAGLGAARGLGGIVGRVKDIKSASDEAKASAVEAATKRAQVAALAAESARAEAGGVAIQSARLNASPDEAVAPRNVVTEAMRQQARLEGAQRVREAALKREVKLRDDAAKAAGRLAEAEVAAQDRTKAAIALAQAQRVRQFESEQRALARLEQDRFKNAASLARLQVQALPDAQAAAGRAAQSIDPFNVASVERYERALARVAQVQANIAAREQRASAIGSAMAFQADAVQKAEVASKQLLTIDEARIQNANALVSARERVADADAKIQRQLSAIAAIDADIASRNERLVGARTQVSLEADSVRAAAADRLAQANRQASASIDAAQLAVQDAAVARAAANMGKLQAATVLAGRAFGSFYNFLGGGFGVALTALAGGLAYWGISAAQAAQETERLKSSLADLPALLKRIDDARASARQGLGSSDDLLQSQGDVEGKIRDQRARLAEIIKGFQDQTGSFATVGLQKRFREAGLGVGRDVAGFFGTQTLKPEQFEKVRDILIEMAEKAGLSSEAMAALSRDLQALGSSSRQIEEAKVAIQELAGAASMDDARRASGLPNFTAMLRDAKTDAENAGKAIEGLAEVATSDLATGLDGIDLVRALGLKGEAASAVERMTKALFEMQNAANGIRNPAISQLVDSLARGDITASQFRDRLQQIEFAGGYLKPVVDGFMGLSKQVESSQDQVSRLQSEINSLTGKTVDILLKVKQFFDPTAGSAYQPMDDARRIQQNWTDGKRLSVVDDENAKVREEIRRAQMNEDQRRRAELGDRFKGADSGLLDQLSAAEAKKKAAEEATKDAERDAERRRKDAAREAKQAAEEARREREQYQEKVKDMLGDQQESLEMQRAEIDLLGKSTEEREVTLARIRAENELKREGISLTSLEGRAILANAEAIARLSIEYDRVSAVQGRIEEIGTSALDGIESALLSGKNAWEELGDVAVQVLQDIAREIMRLVLINPLKNALFGSNLPTMQDAGGMFERLFGGTSGEPINISPNMLKANAAQATGAALGGAAKFGFNVESVANAVGSSLSGAIEAANVPKQVQKVTGAVIGNMAAGATGSFSVVGNALSRGINRVDPRLVDIMKNASLRSGMNVEMFSGIRPGDSRFHGQGLAADVRILDGAGKALPNYQNAGAFRQYEMLAQHARDYQMEKYPELSEDLRWGGYFSGGKGKYGALDTMHFDIGGKRVGMGGGSWEGGLNAQQRKLWPGAESVGMGGSGLNKMSKSFDEAAASVEGLSRASSASTTSLEGLDSAGSQTGQALNTLSTSTQQTGAVVAQAGNQAGETIVGGAMNLGQSAQAMATSTGQSLGAAAQSVQAAAQNVQAASATTGAGGAGGGGGFFGFLSTIFGGFRASGGPVQRGKAYVVGEKGPEILLANSAGKVVPNHKLRSTDPQYDASSIRSPSIDASMARMFAGAESAAGSGMGAATINVINNNGSKVEAREKQEGAQRSIEIVIDESVAKSIGNRGSRSGAAISQRFGMQTIPVNR